MKTKEFKELKVLERPLEKKNRLDDSIRPAVITDAWFDIDDDDSEKPLLVLEVFANDEYGVPVKLLLPIYYNWADKNFTDLLKNLGMMPKPGRSIPLRNFIGIDVVIEVRNLKRWDGKIKTKITRIKRDMVVGKPGKKEWAVVV